MNLGDAVRSHVNGAGDSGNDNRTLPYKSCRDFCPCYHNRALDSVKKGQSSVGIRVAACRRSLPQYAPLGCVTTIHVWQQMIADDIFKTQTFTFVGGGNMGGGFGQFSGGFGQFGGGFNNGGNGL